MYGVVNASPVKGGLLEGSIDRSTSTPHCTRGTRCVRLPGQPWSLD